MSMTSSAVRTYTPGPPARPDANVGQLLRFRERARPRSFERDLETAGPLTRAAGPVLDQLAADLRGAGVAVLLTNERGQVIDRRVPEPGLLVHLDPILPAPGYIYAEGALGTNAMGTALAQRPPCAVEAGEHFADALTTVACAGAPITDPRSGRILGVLDLTSLAAEGSALMLPLATRAAREIEQRLVEDSRVAERLILQRFLQERRRAKGPMVLLTETTMLANAAADRLVAPQDELLLRDVAKELTSEVADDEPELLLSTGIEVTVRAESIADSGRLVGTLLRLTPAAPRLEGKSRVTRGAAAFGWESLTETERSVVDLVAQGLTNREAADRLFLSHHTVGFHLRSIYRKLGVNSRVDLTRLVVEHSQK